MKKCRGQRGKQKLTLEQKEKVSNSENFYFKFQGRFYFAEFSKIKDTFLRFKECVFCNSNHYSTGKFPFLVHLMNHFDQDQELLIDYSEDSVISVYTDSTDRTIKLSELNLNDLDNLISEISAANTLNSLRNNLLNEQAHQYVERFSDVSIVYDHADVLCPVIKGLKDDHFQPFDELVTFLHANKLDKYGIVLLDLELVSSLPEFTSKQLGDKLGGFDVRTQSIKATKSMGCHLIESKPSPRKSTLSNYCKLIQPYSPINEVHLLRDTSEIDFESLSQKSKHRQSKQREIGIYATNIDKSIINDSSDLFKTIINKQLVDLDLPSVSNPYGYLASYRTLFGLHIEDCGLYSFNLNISNGTKIWFGVPNNQYSACLELLRGKFFKFLFFKYLFFCLPQSTHFKFMHCVKQKSENLQV